MRNLPTLLTRVLLLLPGQRVSMVVTLSRSSVSFKDTIPSRLREGVSVVSVQIPKSWFHFGPQTEWFKVAVDFNSIPLCQKSLCPGLVLFLSQPGMAWDSLIKLFIPIR